MSRKNEFSRTLAFVSLIIFLLTLISLSQSVSAIDSVQIYSDAKNINMCNFNISSYNIYLCNPTHTSQVVQIKAVGSGAKFLTFSKDLVLLKPNETEIVTVFLNPNNKLGVYSTKLEFVINDKIIKELDQTFNFKTCRTFNFTVSPLSTCYNNQSNLKIIVGNERASMLNLKIRFHGKTYRDSLAPLEQKILMIPTTYKKLGNFSERITLEDETTGYKQSALVEVNVSSCGQNMSSPWKRILTKIHNKMGAFASFIGSNSTTKTHKWKINLIVFLVVLIILLIVLLILKYKNEKEEHKSIEEPAVEVIQAEPGVGVQNSKSEDHEESKEGKGEKEGNVEVEKVEVNKLLKAKGSSESKLETDQEILSKKPYYKSVMNKIRESHLHGLKVGMKVLLIALVIILLVAFIKFGVSHIRTGNLNLTVNTTLNTTRNITNVSNATTNLSVKEPSHAKNLTITIYKRVKSFIKDYWTYFAIGIVLSILLIIYCNHKAYPCWGEKIQEVKEREVKSKSYHKTKRKSRKKSKKTKKSKK